MFVHFFKDFAPKKAAPFFVAEMLCHWLTRGGSQAAPEFVGGGIGVPGQRVTLQHERHYSL